MVEVGIKGIETVEVVYENTAAALGSGMVEVFSTPMLVALMEKTACNSVVPYLPETEGTVGTEISIKHVAATPIGMTVTCHSELIEVDGRRLVFSVEAHDEEKLVGKGTHERFIINNEKFLGKLMKK